MDYLAYIMHTLCVFLLLLSKFILVKKLFWTLVLSDWILSNRGPSVRGPSLNILDCSLVFLKLCIKLVVNQVKKRRHILKKV